MINSTSVTYVRNRQKWNGLYFPDYRKYNFLNIVRSIPDLFCNTRDASLPQDTLFKTSKYDHVILILADAFGWSQLIKHQNHHAIRFFEERGLISLLTSMFPSTTAAHITSLHTMSSIGKHGIYEWNCYNKVIDDIIQPVIFSDKRVHRSPSIYPQIETIYTKLQNVAISSEVFIPRSYCKSIYNQWATRDAHCFGYSNITDVFKELQKSVEEKSKFYSMVYFEDVDTTGHRFGPNSLQTQNAINQLLDTIYNFVATLTSRHLSKKILFLVTADHGQKHINHNVFINREIPDLMNYISLNQHGKLLVPAGSSRDLFLHIEESKIDEVIHLIKSHLGSEFAVYPTKYLIGQGIFGTQISDNFLNNVGNIVVLPLHDSSIWWDDPSQKNDDHIGNHGGLSQEELEIPLISFEL